MILVRFWLKIYRSVIAHSSFETCVIPSDEYISPKLLKDSTNIIADSLTVIFNNSMETGNFPHHLKVACISPIHKGENKTDFSNYRPVSVISVVAKVFEKLVSVQLIEYLENYQVLSESQTGFRKESLSVTSLLNR